MPFENLCISAGPIPHSISVLYVMLQSVESRGKPVYIGEWEGDLQHTFTRAQLDHLYRLTYASSVDTKRQDNIFKLLSH